MRSVIVADCNDCRSQVRQLIHFVLQLNELPNAQPSPGASKKEHHGWPVCKALIQGPPPSIHPWQVQRWGPLTRLERVSPRRTVHAWSQPRTGATDGAHLQDDHDQHQHMTEYRAATVSNVQRD
jgi:hypothetical protein